MYIIFIQLMINMLGLKFTPLHEKGSEYTWINPLQQGLYEFLYIIAIIMMLGPLKLFLKIKEGKTSFEQMREDYEEDRGSIYRTNQSQSGLLPTTGGKP